MKLNCVKAGVENTGTYNKLPLLIFLSYSNYTPSIQRKYRRIYIYKRLLKYTFKYENYSNKINNKNKHGFYFWVRKKEVIKKQIIKKTN